MPSVYVTKSHLFFTSFREKMPAFISSMIALTFANTAKCLIIYHKNNIVAIMQIAVTIYPVVEKLLNRPVRLVPVLSKNRMKVFISNRNTSNASNKSKRVSIIRSVTTVPNDFENDVLSYFESIPHLVTSPERGMMRLVVYEMKIA